MTNHTHTLQEESFDHLFLSNKLVWHSRQADTHTIHSRIGRIERQTKRAHNFKLNSHTVIYHFCIKMICYMLFHSLRIFLFALLIFLSLFFLFHLQFYIIRSQHHHHHQHQRHHPKSENTESLQQSESLPFIRTLIIKKRI